MYDCRNGLEDGRDGYIICGWYIFRNRQSKKKQKKQYKYKQYVLEQRKKILW